MKVKRGVAKTVDDYIAGVPKDVQPILKRIRTAIRMAAPGAEETISYRIAAFARDGRVLVYLAAFKRHIGLYPAPKGDAQFQKELSAYLSGKATVKMPLDQPIPYALIGKIVELRAKANLERAKVRKAKRAKAPRTKRSRRSPRSR